MAKVFLIQTFPSTQGRLADNIDGVQQKDEEAVGYKEEHGITTDMRFESRSSQHTPLCLIPLAYSRFHLHFCAIAYYIPPFLSSFPFQQCVTIAKSSAS